MIGYLKGKIKYCFADKVILLIGDIGYTVNLGMNTIEGDTIELYVYTAMRENDLSLWGFLDGKELKVFEMLLTVSGVGLRTGQTLIRAIGVKSVISAILSNQPALLRAPGIGEKLTQKIVLEMKGKLEKDVDLSNHTESIVELDSSKADIVDEAYEALLGLGYSSQEAKTMIKKVKSNDYNNASELLKLSLQR